MKFILACLLIGTLQFGLSNTESIEIEMPQSPSTIQNWFPSMEDISSSAYNGMNWLSNKFSTMSDQIMDGASSTASKIHYGLQYTGSKLQDIASYTGTQLQGTSEYVQSKFSQTKSSIPEMPDIID